MENKVEQEVLALVASSQLPKGTFPQGCQISPDGLCVLTSQVRSMILYNIPTTGEAKWDAVLKCDSGDSVRDYEWYPKMNSNDPSTCCFASCSREQPVHLWDAYTGASRATYLPTNRLDEMESPQFLAFDPLLNRLICGGFRTDRMLHIFDLSRPGKTAQVWKLGKTRRSSDGQKGIGSALAVSPTLNMVAVGTVAPGSIYLYDNRSSQYEIGEVVEHSNISSICVVGHGKKARRPKRKRALSEDSSSDVDQSAAESEQLAFSSIKRQWFADKAKMGVTQMEFDDDTHKLWSCSRKSNCVIQWDLRTLSSLTPRELSVPPLASYPVENDTNQRIEFELDDKRRLWVGGTSGRVSVFGARDAGYQKERLRDFTISTNQVVNGISVCLKRGALVAACGSRQFPSQEDWDCIDGESGGENPYKNCLAAETGKISCYSLSNNKNAVLPREEG